MKSSKSAVRVALKIDATRYDYLAALAKVRGLTVSQLASSFLAERLTCTIPLGVSDVSPRGRV